MSNSLLNERDSIMTKSAVNIMKMKNLKEFKRQTTVSILQQRALDQSFELRDAGQIANEQSVRLDFQDYLNDLCVRKQFQRNLDESASLMPPSQEWLALKKKIGGNIFKAIQ